MRSAEWCSTAISVLSKSATLEQLFRVIKELLLYFQLIVG